MLLKQLEYFVSVVERNSFTQAANEQYVSQSAISQQIKSLEASLGVELIVREKRSFHLTPAGEYFYRTGKKLLDRVQEIKIETVRIGTDTRSTLRIGYLNRYSGIAMSQAIINMTKRYRDLDVRMYSGSHEELLGMIDDRRIDIAFNDVWPPATTDYTGVPVGTATTVVEVPHGYTTDGTIELKEINDLPLILVCRGQYTINEESHYRRYMNFQGAFTYARTLEEARFLVAGNQGMLLIDRFKYLTDPLPGIERKRITNHNAPIEQDYYFYTPNNRVNNYTEAFQDIFKKALDEF